MKKLVHGLIKLLMIGIAAFGVVLLFEKMSAGKLGFFGCDVYSTEPFSEDHPFYGIREMDNVCLTPHMAWGAYEARARCMDEILQNIRSFMEGGNRNRVE